MPTNEVIGSVIALAAVIGFGFFIFRKMTAPKKPTKPGRPGGGGGDGPGQQVEK